MRWPTARRHADDILGRGERGRGPSTVSFNANSRACSDRGAALGEQLPIEAKCHDVRRISYAL